MAFARNSKSHDESKKLSVPRSVPILCLASIWYNDSVSIARYESVRGARFPSSLEVITGFASGKAHRMLCYEQENSQPRLLGATVFRANARGVGKTKRYNRVSTEHNTSVTSTCITLPGRLFLYTPQSW